jgi:hypothetical protein
VPNRHPPPPGGTPKRRRIWGFPARRVERGFPVAKVGIDHRGGNAGALTEQAHRRAGEPLVGEEVTCHVQKSFLDRAVVQGHPQAGSCQAVAITPQNPIFGKSSWQPLGARSSFQPDRTLALSSQGHRQPQPIPALAGCPMWHDRYGACYALPPQLWYTQGVRKKHSPWRRRGAR